MAPIPPTKPLSPSDLRYGLVIQDLGHDGVEVFLKIVGPNPCKVLQRAAAFVLQMFYRDVPAHLQPTSIESITLHLRSMPGVAHTCGTPKDKEIHFSLDYVKSLSSALAPSEVEGVIMHEMVHCFQYDALGTCPGGLIEGIADFIRLRAGLAPPHWNRSKPSNWDVGYEKTGYFLDWIEKRRSSNVETSFVRDLNLSMSHQKFAKSLFEELTGLPLSRLWDIYTSDEN